MTPGDRVRARAVACEARADACGRTANLANERMMGETTSTGAFFSMAEAFTAKVRAEAWRTCAGELRVLADDLDAAAAASDHEPCPSPYVSALVQYTSGSVEQPVIYAAIITELKAKGVVSLRVFAPVNTFSEPNCAQTTHPAGTPEALGRWSWPIVPP